MFQNYFQECRFVIFTGSAPLAPLQLQVWLRQEWINVAVTAPVRIPRAWMNGGNQLQLQVLILVQLSNHHSYRIRPFWISLEFFVVKPQKSFNFQKCWDPSHRDRGLVLGLYFPSVLFSPLRSRWPATDCFRAFGPKSGKIAEKWIFASPGKWGKKWPENGKNRPKMAQKCHFWFISPFFSHFWWGHNPFFGHCPPISGRRPEISLWQVNGTVRSVCSSCRVSQTSGVLINYTYTSVIFLN